MLGICAFGASYSGASELYDSRYVLSFLKSSRLLTSAPVFASVGSRICFVFVDAFCYL